MSVLTNRRVRTLRQAIVALGMVAVVAGGALVVTKCPTCGVVAVKIGSRTVRINLYARTNRTKQVIALPSVRFQTSVVVVTVVSSGKPVIIDGLGIGRPYQDLV